MALPGCFGDGVDADEGNFKITINKKYAEKYQKFKECQELDKLKRKYADEDDGDESSSESEDDDADALTPQIEQDFLQVLSMIKQKDPKIYEKDAVFFSELGHDNDNSSNKKHKSKKDKQPIFLKDYERQRLLVKGEKAYVSDSDDEAPLIDEEIERLKKKQNGTTYVQEQEEIKKNLVSAAQSDSDDDGDLLQVRRKVTEDATDQLSKEKLEKQNITNTLNRYWKSDQLDNDEKFLRDYILKKQFISSESSEIPAYNEIVGEDDEEPSDEEGDREEFERKFNFRYEEPDPEFIKRYPRTINESVRRKDDRRKQQRKVREERKEKEREKKKDELKRLKKLKRKEIMEKIEKLKEITGNRKVGFLEEDMQDDFDMSKYDELMEKVFDDDYYNDETVVDEEKPVFPDEEEDGDEYYEDYGNGDVDEQFFPHCEDPNFNMDADFVENLSKKGKLSKKRKGLNARFTEAVDREKPLFDPTHQTFEEYFDEYYKLDFEDIIGDMPIRFKYREVVPNDFGLSMDELLKADDKELNEWCSLKKTTQYLGDDEEKKLQQKFKKKARSRNKKLQVFSSLREELEKQQIADNPNLETIGHPKVIKQKQKKKLKLNIADGKGKLILKKKTLVPSWNNQSRRTIISSVNKSKIRNIRKNFKGGSDRLIKKLSLERLASYGLDGRNKAAS